MKSFVLSAILFAVMLAGIVGNALYVNHICDDMLTILAELPDEATTAGDTAAVLKTLETLEGRWNEAHRWLSLSASYCEIGQIRSEMTAMRVHFIAADDDNYLCAREQLKLAIENMRRFEQFSVDNLM